MVRYGVLPNILPGGWWWWGATGGGWLAAGAGGGAPNAAPYLQAPVPVNWPEKWTVKALRPQWGSASWWWGSPAAPQLGSCLMKECGPREVCGAAREEYGEAAVWKSSTGAH